LEDKDKKRIFAAVMKVQLINQELLKELHEKAAEGERLRMNFDLRTTPEDGSQRMLNAVEPGTQVPIHRHEETSETVICLHGRLDIVFYEDASESGNGFQETFRATLCPAKGQYGAQIPKGAWHSIEVYEPSTIFEAKDGAYKG
jgi:cupin fold WbuC family metalloprotein